MTWTVQVASAPPEVNVTSTVVLTVSAEADEARAPTSGQVAATPARSTFERTFIAPPPQLPPEVKRLAVQCRAFDESALRRGGMRGRSAGCELVALHPWMSRRGPPKAPALLRRERDRPWAV